MMQSQYSDEGKKDDPILINGLEASKFLGIKPTSWYSLKVSGKLPRAITLGRREMWIKKELLEWVAAGCPGQTKWEQIKAQKNNKKH